MLGILKTISHRPCLNLGSPSFYCCDLFKLEDSTASEGAFVFLDTGILLLSITSIVKLKVRWQNMERLIIQNVVNKIEKHKKIFSFNKIKYRYRNILKLEKVIEFGTKSFVASFSTSKRAEFQQECIISIKVLTKKIED